MKFDRQLRPATETSWVVSYGGKTIPRWRTAAILKIDRSPYLSEQELSYCKQIARQLPTQYVEGFYRSNYAWLWNLGQGSLKVTEMVPFESLSMVSYSPSIVNIAVSLAISQIFSIKEWPDLGIWVWGRSRSFKMVRFDRPCTTFY